MSVLAGFGTGMSLIAAIGAQNAFVLRQGLRREHVPAVVAFCALADLVLVTAAVAGVGLVLARAPGLLEVVRWGGIAYLVGYALLAVRRAVRPGVLAAGLQDAVELGRVGHQPPHLRAHRAALGDGEVGEVGDGAR